MPRWQGDITLRRSVLHIKTASFRFVLKVQEPLLLPSYKGSTLRGGFGYAFKRVVCVIRDKECPGCLLKEKCIYSYVFETPPPSNTKIMRKYQAAPHPFVIEPPMERRRGYKTGDDINFSLILVGRAIDYLPYFIYTFDELGRIGIGKGKARFELREVSCEGKTIYDSENKTLRSFKTSSLSLDTHLSLRGEAAAISKLGAISLSFLTPARILYDGHLTLDIEFHILVRNLLRRLSLLSYFHCGGDPSGWNFKGLIEKAKEVKVVDRKLKWYDWERY